MMNIMTFSASILTERIHLDKLIWYTLSRIPRQIVVSSTRRCQTRQWRSMKILMMLSTALWPYLSTISWCCQAEKNILLLWFDQWCNWYIHHRLPTNKLDIANWQANWMLTCAKEQVLAGTKLDIQEGRPVLYPRKGSQTSWWRNKLGITVWKLCISTSELGWNSS